MEDNWVAVTQRILHVTLKIIGLVTAEDNVVVRKLGDHVFIDPPPSLLLHKSDDVHKILELFHKIIQLVLQLSRLPVLGDVCKIAMTADGPGSGLGSDIPTSSLGLAMKDASVTGSIVPGLVCGTSSEKKTTHVRGDEGKDACVQVKEEPDLSGLYTKEDCVSIKPEPLSIDEGTLTDTGNKQCPSLSIKEESVSDREEYVPEHESIAAHMKEESSSCEEGYVHVTDIYSLSDPTLTGEDQKDSYHMVKPNRNGLDYRKCYPTEQQHVHRSTTSNCPECGKSFPCNSALIRHQAAHTAEKPFTCPECGKCMSSKAALTVHQRIHKGEKPFPCSECGRHFLFKSHLVRHQIKHTGAKPFCCSDCGKSYSSKAAIVMHQRLHSGDSLYPCTECGKCFVQKNHLQQHWNIHTGEKPFACPQCGKRFIQKSNLKQHLSVHVPKKKETFLCPECGKCYKRRADYRWHMLIHLGERRAVT